MLLTSEIDKRDCVLGAHKIVAELTEILAKRRMYQVISAIFDFSTYCPKGPKNSLTAPQLSTAFNSSSIARAEFFQQGHANFECLTYKAQIFHDENFPQVVSFVFSLLGYVTDGLHDICMITGGQPPTSNDSGEIKAPICESVEFDSARENAQYPRGESPWRAAL